VRLKGLGKFKKKKSFASSDLEPATFWFVAQSLNQYATACPLPLPPRKECSSLNTVYCIIRNDVV
jgi:hypothetical protein